LIAFRVRVDLHADVGQIAVIGGIEVASRGGSRRHLLDAGLHPGEPASISCGCDTHRTVADIRRRGPFARTERRPAGG